jgi:hypothetical protein
MICLMQHGAGLFDISIYVIKPERATAATAWFSGAYLMRKVECESSERQQRGRSEGGIFARPVPLHKCNAELCVQRTHNGEWKVSLDITSVISGARFER